MRRCRAQSSRLDSDLSVVTRRAQTAESKRFGRMVNVWDTAHTLFSAGQMREKGYGRQMPNVQNSQSPMRLRTSSGAQAACVSGPFPGHCGVLNHSGSQRKVLLEQIRRKDAIIESFRQMLKPHMLQHLHSGSENNPSSGSPPSSAAHEEPLRKQVLEWLEKAEASKVSTGSFNLDSRAFNDSSSEDNDEPVDKFNSNPSSLSRPPLNQPHSYRYSTSSGGGGDGVDLSRRSRSPRMMRSSAIHPVELLARASLRGSGMGSRPSSVGEPLPSTASPAEIGVARHDYFVSGDSMAKRASQLGLRKIEIDRGLSEEPKLLRKGLIVPEEVDKLFGIFYDKLNVSRLIGSRCTFSHPILALS